MTQRLQRRTYIWLALALMVGLAFGMLSHTVYARFHGPDAIRRTMDTLFVNVTVPVADLQSGANDFVLIGDRIGEQKYPTLTVTLVKSGSLILLADQSACTATETGWCLRSKEIDWVFDPEFFYSEQVGNTTYLSGHGNLRQVGGVLGDLNGVADFRATIVNNPDGVEIFINLDGFFGKLL